jgi:hypothetical protein
MVDCRLKYPIFKISDFDRYFISYEMMIVIIFITVIIVVFIYFSSFFFEIFIIQILNASIVLINYIF